jgi:hypothetical protein
MILSQSYTSNSSYQRTIYQGGISSASETVPDNVCSTIIVDSICWFNISTVGSISSGDIAYDDAAGTNPILGNNRYYKVSLSGISYAVLINNSGVITVSTTCG